MLIYDFLFKTSILTNWLVSFPLLLKIFTGFVFLLGFVDNSGVCERERPVTGCREMEKRCDAKDVSAYKHVPTLTAETPECFWKTVFLAWSTYKLFAKQNQLGHIVAHKRMYY